MAYSNLSARPSELALANTRARVWLGGIALVSLGAVAAALVSQFMFNMQPCPWCILQRLIYLAIAVLAGVAALLGARLLRTPAALATLLLAAAGTATTLYQHFVAAKLQSCNLTLADRIVNSLSLDQVLPSVFQVTASCADAAVNIAGVPYEFWSLGLYVLLALAALRVAFVAFSRN